MIEFKVIGSYEERTEVYLHDTEVLNAQAKMAANFIEKWGMVAAVPDGEDSAGRQKLRLQTSLELAMRACETAAAVFEEFKYRKWITTLPTLAQIEAMVGKGD